MTWLTLAFVAQLAAPNLKLDYAGHPLTVAHECSEEEIHTLGLACTREDPCPVYLELAGHEVLGNTIVLTGNIHNREVTYSSILLMSEDMGKTWTEPIPRIKTGVLDQVQFIDFQNGWAAGQLIQQQLPRDPFLLITNDGGRVWRRRPLYDDGRLGSIEQFWFDTRSSGGLIVDRSTAGEPAPSTNTTKPKPARELDSP